MILPCERFWTPRYLWLPCAVQPEPRIRCCLRFWGGQLAPLVSVPLVLEYEAVLTRTEHLAATGIGAEEAVKIVKAFCLERNQSPSILMNCVEGRHSLMLAST